MPCRCQAEHTGETWRHQRVALLQATHQGQEPGVSCSVRALQPSSSESCSILNSEFVGSNQIREGYGTASMSDLHSSSIHVQPASQGSFQSHALLPSNVVIKLPGQQCWLVKGRSDSYAEGKVWLALGPQLYYFLNATSKGV